jgi:hypothetical protein
MNMERNCLHRSLFPLGLHLKRYYVFYVHCRYLRTGAERLRIYAADSNFSKEFVVINGSYHLNASPGLVASSLVRVASHCWLSSLDPYVESPWFQWWAVTGSELGGFRTEQLCPLQCCMRPRTDFAGPRAPSILNPCGLESKREPQSSL